MIRSMTGYGRAEEMVGGRLISVEIRSVNHRYFDFTAKLPRNYAYLEEKIKAFIQKNVARGKIEVYLNLGAGETQNLTVDVDHSLAKAYLDAIGEISEKYGLSGDVSASFIGRLPEVMTVSKAVEDEEAVTADVLSVAQKALDAFVEMRTNEGERLKIDVENRLENILELVSYIEKQSPLTVSAYKTRLENKIREILNNSDIDDNRILTEVAIFADKVAVDEETVRLRSHISAMRDLMQKDEAVGKKMDFLVQEMNREANTTGSKCQDSEITKRVVDIKAEIEKIREQIQNIE